MSNEMIPMSKIEEVLDKAIRAGHIHSSTREAWIVMFATGITIQDSKWVSANDGVIATFASESQARALRDKLTWRKEVPYEEVEKLTRQWARPAGWCQDGVDKYLAMVRPVVEPTKVGAVIRSDYGFVYVRSNSKPSTPWVTRSGSFTSWDKITQPVTVLSEGVDIPPHTPKPF